MHKLIINTSFIGQNLINLPSCQSTNQYAMDLKESDHHPEGTTVLTFHQTAGRGQRGNRWEANPYENITLSVILQPHFLPIEEQFALNKVVSVAVYDFLRPYLGKSLRIKWPNDILNQEKKLGGILIENVIRGQSLEKSVVGIGININQEHFAYPQASSLKSFTNRDYNLYSLIPELLSRVEENYILLKQGKKEQLDQAYLERLFRYQQKGLYRNRDGQFFEATLKGVAPDGRLMLEEAEGVKYYGFKEVVFIY